MTQLNSFALDESVRRIDADGHLHVERCILSAATVSRYLGREIPHYTGLGLAADGLYQLYRDPKALEEAAASMEGKPILCTHKPINADAHPRELTVGSVNNVRFEAPNLIGSLSIWDGDAIRAIQDGSKRCVSAGYAYRVAPISGEIEAQPYQFTMQDIRFNHLALVDTPRVQTAIIGDQSPPPPQEALSMPTLENVRIAAKLAKALKTGVIALDSDEAAIYRVIAQDEADDPKEEKETKEAKEADEDKSSPKAEDDEADEDDKRKKSEDSDESDEDNKSPKKKDDDGETAQAQDAALKRRVDQAVRSAVDLASRRARDAENARLAVRPLVGEVNGFDRAADIYTYALKHVGYDVSDVHPSALPMLTKMALGQARPQQNFAQDRASDGLAQRFGTIKTPRKL